MGLLEKVVVQSWRIEYEHTFAVVDFGKKNNYDIILGRPFMRQLKMVQDWGYDYIYLRHMETTTRINLKDHSFRDVMRTLVEDFESATQRSLEGFTWKSKPQAIWMCGAFDCGSLVRQDGIIERAIEDPFYMPEPFPEEMLEPFE